MVQISLQNSRPPSLGTNESKITFVTEVLIDWRRLSSFEVVP